MSPHTPPRVVLDTNLVLSALVFQNGHLARLRMLWQTEKIIPLVSKATMTELIRALSYPKFRLSADDQEALLADYLLYCATVTIPDPPPETPPCRDGADTPFLQLAVVGQADALVTGDKDLLALANVFAGRILSADVFLTELG